MWTYVSDARFDSNNKWVVLTENIGPRVGIIWLNANVSTDFTAEFSYKTGPDTDPVSGGDGLVFMFYKEKGYIPAAGGYLGFTDLETNPVPGYGIEFDQFDNYGLFNEIPNHVALIKDYPGNHLAITGEDPRVSDDQWHQVRVVVQAPSIAVYLDGGQVLSWNGSINTSYSGMGFSAATWAATNQHLIDNVTIREGCYLAGNNPPCGVVSLSEVVDAINMWAVGKRTLLEVVELINAWAAG